MNFQIHPGIIKRIKVYGGTVIVAAPVVLCFLAVFFANMATQVSHGPNHILADAFLPHPATKEFTKSFDGKKISFWYLPQNDSALKPTIIVIHGLGASKEHMASNMFLAQNNGYPVVAIDLRGHGDSDNSRCSFGYYEKHDVIAVMNWLREKGKTRFVLWGVSMGAVTTAITAETQPQGLAGIIMDAPFDTLRNTLTHHAKVFFKLPHYPLLPLIYWRIEQIAKFDTKAIDVPRALKAVHVPVLIIVGAEDVRMPLPMVRSIYEQANEPKTFYAIPGEGHDSRAFDSKFQSTITTFLKTL